MEIRDSAIESKKKCCWLIPKREAPVICVTHAHIRARNARMPKTLAITKTTFAL